MEIFFILAALAFILAGPAALIISIIALKNINDLKRELKTGKFHTLKTPSPSEEKPKPAPEAKEQAEKSAGREDAPQKAQEAIPPFQKTQPGETAAQKTKTPKNETAESAFVISWAAKIGVIAIVIGMGFFLKYAWDHGWIARFIGPAGRIIIGVITGIGFLKWADYLEKKSFKILSRAVAGGGIAILYFSIYAAFSFYELINQTSAFIFMILITAASLLLSLKHNSRTIALLGMLGGFLTPVMLSTGEVKHIELFSYIAILNIGGLTLSYFKKWGIIDFFAFFATFILFLAWYGSDYKPEFFGESFFFLTLFFIIFSARTVLRNIYKKQKSGIFDLSLVFLTAAVYFFTAYDMLEYKFEDYLALFALALAVIYFILAYAAMKKNKDDKYLIFNLLGLSIIFLTVMFPIQFEGYWLSVLWAAQAAVLAWAGVKADNKLTRLASWAVIILALFSLTEIGSQTAFKDGMYEFTPVLNKRFFSFLFIIASMYFTTWAYSNDKKKIFKNSLAVIIILAQITTLWLLYWEINDFCEAGRNNARIIDSSGYKTWQDAREFSISIITALYAAALIIIGIRKNIKFLRTLALALFTLTIIKIFLVDVFALKTAYRIFSFIGLGVTLIIVSSLYQKHKDKINKIFILLLIFFIPAIVYARGENKKVKVYSANEGWKITNETGQPIDTEIISSLKYCKQINFLSSMYVKVKLDKEVLNSIQANLADMRVVNNNNREIPYAVQINRGLKSTVKARSKIYNKSAGEKTVFHIDLGNGFIEHNLIELLTQDENFRFSVKIEGSENGNKWFVLNDNAGIYDFTTNEIKNRYVSIGYPLAYYRYLKLTVNGGLNVDGVSVYKHTDIKPEEIKITEKEMEFYNYDNPSKTAAVIDLMTKGRLVNKIEFSVKNKNYHRKINVYEKINDDWKLLKSGVIFSYITDKFRDENNSFYFPESRSRYIKLEIFDYDDAPLDIEDISLYELPQYIVFKNPEVITEIDGVKGNIWIAVYNENKHMTAKLFYGGKVNKPYYDFEKILSYVSNGNVGIGELEEKRLNPFYTHPKDTRPWSEKYPALLWIILIGGGGLLVFGIFKTFKSIRFEDED